MLTDTLPRALAKNTRAPAAVKQDGQGNAHKCKCECGLVSTQKTHTHNTTQHNTTQHNTPFASSCFFLTRTLVCDCDELVVVDGHNGDDGAVAAGPIRAGGAAVKEKALPRQRAAAQAVRLFIGSTKRSRGVERERAGGGQEGGGSRIAAWSE